jgi:hypothetical protein
MEANFTTVLGGRRGRSTDADTATVRQQRVLEWFDVEFSRANLQAVITSLGREQARIDNDPVLRAVDLILAERIHEQELRARAQHSELFLDTCGFAADAFEGVRPRLCELVSQRLRYARDRDRDRDCDCDILAFVAASYDALLLSVAAEIAYADPAAIFTRVLPKSPDPAVFTLEDWRDLLCSSYSQDATRTGSWPRAEDRVSLRSLFIIILAAARSGGFHARGRFHTRFALESD